MSELLYINASPRGEASASTQAATLFLQALSSTVTVTRLDLFHSDLPEYTPELARAKQKFAMSDEMTEEEARQWREVTALVNQLTRADYYLLAVPMWNFSVPYKLKQYIDLVTHPGLTFIRDAEGIRGLASGGVTVIFARGGHYSPKNGQPDPYDFQSPYLSAWLGLVGLGPVSEVLVQGTLTGADAATQAVNNAREQLESLAKRLT